MRKRIIFLVEYWLPVLVIAGIIFKLSSGTVPLASPVYWQDFSVKKFAHISIFGLLAVLIYRALIAGGMLRRKALILAIFLAIFYGGTDEIHQRFTQGRESRLTDVGFDGVGACLAMFLDVRILPKMPKRIVDLVKKLNLI